MNEGRQRCAGSLPCQRPREILQTAVTGVSRCRIEAILAWGSSSWSVPWLESLSRCWTVASLFVKLGSRGARAAVALALGWAYDLTYSRDHAGRSEGSTHLIFAPVLGALNGLCYRVAGMGIKVAARLSEFTEPSSPA